MRAPRGAAPRHAFEWKACESGLLARKETSEKQNLHNSALPAGRDPCPPRAAQAEPAAPVAALRPPHVLQAGPAATSRHREPPFGVNPSASSRHSAPAATPSAASRPAPRRMPGRIIPACSSACSFAAARPAGIIPTRNPSAIIPTCNPSAVTSLVSPGLNARNRRLFRVFQPGDTFRVTALSEGRELQYNLVRWMTAYGYVAFKRTSPSFASRFSGMRARLRQAAQPPLAHPFRFLSPCVLMPPSPQPPLSSHPFVPFRPLPPTVRTLRPSRPSPSSRPHPDPLRHTEAQVLDYS